MVTLQVASLLAAVAFGAHLFYVFIISLPAFAAVYYRRGLQQNEQKMSKTGWSCSFFVRFRRMRDGLCTGAAPQGQGKKTLLLRDARCGDMPYASNPFTSCLARSRIP
jgi:hypothetical protein